MKQPKLKVTDLQGNEVCISPIRSIEWLNNGKLWCVTIQGIIPTEHLYFYYENKEFVESTGQLKGILIYE